MIDRLIYPLALASIAVSVAAIFTVEVALGFAAGWIFLDVIRLEGERRHRAFQERRRRMMRARDPRWPS